jgi:hypothetical protein
MSLPNDKILHFFAGVGVSLCAALFAGSTAWGFLAAVAAGYGKEFYDSKHPDRHTLDIWDSFFTSLGGLTPAVLYFFYKGTFFS